jgi:hypothetical protein
MHFDGYNVLLSIPQFKFHPPVQGPSWRCLFLLRSFLPSGSEVSVRKNSIQDSSLIIPLLHFCLKDLSEGHIAVIVHGITRCGHRCGNGIDTLRMQVYLPGAR